MMGLTYVLGCNQVDDTGIILQGLSALVTEAMRDAHGKSVAVRLELCPHLSQILQSIPILFSLDNICSVLSAAWRGATGRKYRPPSWALFIVQPLKALRECAAQ